MKNKITELVCILDRSGSMGGLENDTIGGFNAMLEKQRKAEGTCLVTTVLFDHERVTLHDRVPLEQVRPMTAEDYTVRGSTALLDAVGATVRHIEGIHRYARPEDVPEHTVFVITTDGMENASRTFTGAQVRQMIEQAKEARGWEFLFLGANIDAAEAAAQIGISRDRAANYHADGRGTKLVYESVAKAVSSMRCSACIEEDWDEALREDYSSRKR